MKNYLDRLFRYLAWADERSLEALRNSPAAHNEALPLMSHLLAAEHIWLARLELRIPNLAVWPGLSLDECHSLAAENAAGYLTFVDGISDEQLATPILYRSSGGQEFSTKIGDILMQVLTHGPYHRGQIAKIIGRAGGIAINTDYITYARET